MLNICYFFYDFKIYQGNSSLREFYALHNEVGKFTSETNFKLDEKSKAALRSFEGNLDEQSVMAYSSILHYGGLIETAKNMGENLCNA